MHKQTEVKKIDNFNKKIFRDSCKKECPGDVKKRAQLHNLVMYSISGCAINKLNEEKMEKLFLFAKNERTQIRDEEIETLLAEAIPKAYQGIIIEKRTCRDYFFGEHNKRVSEMPIDEGRKNFCLAREGIIKKIIDLKISKVKFNIRNVELLKSNVGKRLYLLGVIEFFDGSREFIFLDFLKKARIESKVIVHRNVACGLI